jgi:hypothetical protein
VQLSELCGRRRCWACQQGELLQGVGTGVAPCTRQVPELPLDLGPRGRDALGGGGGEAPAAAPRLRRKGHAVDVTRVQALEVEASLAGGDVEEGGGVVVRGEGEEVAVGGEGDAVDVIRVEALQVEASLASPGVEEGGGLVSRGEGEEVAVGGEGDAGDGFRVEAREVVASRREAVLSLEARASAISLPVLTPASS